MILTLSAVLFIVLAIPLILGIVPRNWFYGVRTPRTLADVVVETPGGLITDDINARGDLLATQVEMEAGVMVYLPGFSSERNLSWMNFSLWPILSRDGAQVVFLYGGDGYSAFLRKTDGSPALRVGDGIPLALSPDGKQVLALRITPHELVVYPTGPGERTVLAKGPIANYQGMGAWFPDGRRILLCGSEVSRGLRCYEQSLDGGLPKPLTPEGVVGAYLSIDGQQLLAKDARSNWQVVELAGGTLRAPAGLRSVDAVAGWARDGSAVFVWNSTEVVPSRLERVDLQTGTRRLVREIAPPDRAGLIAVNPNSVIEDARGYAYHYLRNIGKLYIAEGATLVRP